MTLPSGTVSFLLTDIEGSTRLLRELGAAYARSSCRCTCTSSGPRSRRPAATSWTPKGTPCSPFSRARATIREAHPDVGVLVLSQYVEARYAAPLLKLYPSRVGYLLKDRLSDMAILTDAIRRIYEGECVVDPTIVQRLMNRAQGKGTLGEVGDEDRVLLALTAEGHSDDAIAGRVGMSAGDVAARLNGLFEELGVASTAVEVRRAAPLLELLRSSDPSSRAADSA